MLAKITLYDGTIYRIADKTTDTQDGIYLGRIKDELSLVSAMQEAGNAPATINLTIINHDDFIPHNKDLWAAEVLLTNDNGVSWRGKINFCNFDADGNLYVTASEKTAPELELQLPDEVRQVYTVDEDFHQSSVTMTIPLVVGGTHEKPILVPTILIDKTQGIYLICVGEIREIVAVYNGTERLSLADYGSYRGTAEQVYHKGFAYVALNSGKRLNADGSYAEINVEVVGLKLGNFTEEECRNGALFLYYFLTTASSGINGWGCGIDQSEIDTASFQSAITLCNQLGYKLDGIMWLRQSAQSWIDQICQAIHGKYSINANGKRSLFIDYAGNASKKTFTASNMQVDKYGKNSYTSVVYNKGILSYDYNPITGLFMQSAQYENAESIAQIGEQKFVGESYLIKDPTTALAVLEYTCKRSQTAAEAIEFKTDDIDTLLRAGDVITINRPDLSINNALYQIQNISITDYEASISAVKFDTSVFIVSGTPSSVNWGSEKSITPALTPAQATNLLLSTGFDINPDGTGTPYISGTFTVPDGGWLAAAVQYGIGAEPTNWTELALITDGRFKISPVNVGTVYSVRIRMITATGHSDYLRGQITATGDTVPPSEPTIAAKATDRTVTVQCGLDNPPYDMGGFQIYRKKSTEQVYTYIGSIAANRGYASFSDYVDEYVTYNYQAKSYDRSGNLSTNFSNVASVTVTGIQANDVAATALAMPTGSILRISAKNCTTASIAESKGVKDVSGNNKHGKAIGGVEIVKDNVLGDCFFFNGTDSSEKGCLSFLDYPDFFSGLNGVTYSLKFRSTNISAVNNFRVLFLANGDADNSLFASCSIYSDGKIEIQLEVKPLTTSGKFISEVGVIQQDKNYNLIISSDFVEGKMYVYLDGALIGQTDINRQSVVGNIPYSFNFGSHYANATYKNYRFIGFISDIRIYPRVITATEAKSIFMLPEETLMGQLTADLIGANIIKGTNLYSENIITQAAQINQAVFQSLIVTNGSTVANQVSVGGRNLALASNTQKTISGKNRLDYNLSDYGKTNVVNAGKITVSAEVKCTEANKTIDFYLRSNSSATTTVTSASVNPSTTEFSKLQVTFDAPTVTTSITVTVRSYSSSTNTTYVKNIKCEIGNKATDWTPAPEDVDSDINTVQSNLNTVTTNIYSPNTTTINGGKITTGTITANAIAANAITAEKLTISSTRAVSGLLMYKLSAKGAKDSLSADECVGNLGGEYVGRDVRVVGSLTTVRNTSLGKVFSDNATGMLEDKNPFYQINAGATFCAWINISNTSEDRWIFDARTSDYKFIWDIRMSSGKIRFFTRNNSSTDTNLLSESTIYADTWYFIACVSTGSQKRIYINSVLNASANQNTGNFTPSAVNFFGHKLSGSSTYLKGSFGNVYFFNRELSLDEIKRIHNMGTDTEAGQITADRIAAGSVETRHLTADAIVGKTFQTASNTGTNNAAGVRFNSSGIQGFNGSAKKFDLSTNGKLTCSDVDLTGKITATSGSFGSCKIDTTDSENKNCSMYLTSSKYKAFCIEATGDFIQWLNGSQRGVVIMANPAGVGESLLVKNSSNASRGGFGCRIESSGGDALIVKYSGTDTSASALYVTGKAYCSAGVWSGCDENLKKDIKDVSTLDKLKSIRVKKFKYSEKKVFLKDWVKDKKNEIKYNVSLLDRKTMPEPPEDNENSPEFIMAMAGEFNKAFGVDNGNEESINYTNAVGVCMRAIQELAEQFDNAVLEIKELKNLLKQKEEETR